MAMEGHAAGIWTALPCIVAAVNLEAMTISAQPAIQGVVQNAEGESNSVDLPLLVDVPIVFPSAGGFSLTLPIAAGDEVLVVFSSRCIDAWWQSGGVGRAIEARMHDLSDGFAIPGPRSQARKVPNISATNVQIRADDGETYVEITPGGKIRMVAPTAIEAVAPDILLDGNVNVTGTLTQSTGTSGTATLNGNLHVTGAIVADGDVTGQGTSLHNHTHGGVQSGGSNTGEPN